MPADNSPLAALGGYTKREEIANAVTHGVALVLAIAAWSCSSPFRFWPTRREDDRKRRRLRFGHGGAVPCFDSLSRDPEPKGEALAAGLRPFGDLHPDRGLLHAVFASHDRRDGGNRPLRRRLERRDARRRAAAFPSEARRLGSTAFLYLCLGWAIHAALGRPRGFAPDGGVWLLAAGGVVYSLGVIFYLIDRIPYNHAIWHVFVLAGTALQFFSVFFYVLPPV